MPAKVGLPIGFCLPDTSQLVREAQVSDVFCLFTVFPPHPWPPTCGAVNGKQSQFAHVFKC